MIIINSPFNGNFKVTQIQHSNHDGLDLVGLESKDIHSTVNGVVEVAGWQNPNNRKEGFGLYVRIRKDGSNDCYYFGHLSEVRVKAGSRVKITDVIGIEGSTGNSTGSHLHYCVRGNASKSAVRNVSTISGIPNALGIYNDGYVPNKPEQDKPVATPTVAYQVYANGKWLPNVKNDTDFAGIKNCQISGLKASVSSGSIEYQAHTVNGQWYAWVKDLSDYAGVIGKPIDCIRARLVGVSGYVLQTRVAPVGKDYYPWVTNDSDYAGSLGKAIDRLQMRIVKK